MGFDPNRPYTVVAVAPDGLSLGVLEQWQRCVAACYPDRELRMIVNEEEKVWLFHYDDEYTSEVTTVIAEDETGSNASMTAGYGDNPDEDEEKFTLPFTVAQEDALRVADALIAVLEESKGPNFVTMTVKKDGEPYSLTVSRVNGKSVTEVLGELRAEIAELREKAAV